MKKKEDDIFSLKCCTRSFIHAGLLLALVLLLLPSRSVFAADPPTLWLPIPVGETWEIIQGFNWNTHAGELEIDLVRVEGGTIGAPVRAAASGQVYFWTASSGTLLIAHGDGYYTEYTHLSQTFVYPGTHVYQGEEIGLVGGTAHLHFSLYHSSIGSYFSRQTLPLHFADGYDLPDTGGYNQHTGMTLTARDNPDESAPVITFSSSAEPDQWYCQPERIEFRISDDRSVRGFSQEFDQEPASDTPVFDAEEGYMETDWAGEGKHILYVRAWDASGNQTLASFGPVGYDATPPVLDAPAQAPKKTYDPDKDGSVHLSWDSADDGDGSGVAGYHVYLGSDSNGTSETFTDHNGIDTRDLAPGCYLLRVQAMDHACGTSEWVTLQRVLVANREGTVPYNACASLGEPAQGTAEPTATATTEPTDEPTATATPEPTDEPTATATPEPTDEPTATATPEPTDEPTATATPEPTDEPTATATPEPTNEPTATTTPEPTDEPTATTTPEPTDEPTATATPEPTNEPTATATPEPIATTRPGMSQIPGKAQQDDNVVTVTQPEHSEPSHLILP